MGRHGSAGRGRIIALGRLTTGMQVALWNPIDTCPQVPALLMLQVDPERFRFSIHQYRDEGLRAPISIHDWQQRTDAYVMFNAGLFREDYSYLGVLLKEGRSLGVETSFVARTVCGGTCRRITSKSARLRSRV